MVGDDTKAIMKIMANNKKEVKSIKGRKDTALGTHAISK